MDAFSLPVTRSLAAPRQKEPSSAPRCHTTALPQEKHIMTALDRALESTTVVDWRVIRRIIQRQTSAHWLFRSLKRLLRVPRVPIDLIRFVLTRLEGTLGEYEISTTDVWLCIHYIWYNVLVDRDESGTPSGFSYSLEEPLKATEEYTNELLAVTNGASLQSNEVIYNAFELTKLVVLDLSWRGIGVHIANRDSVLFLPLVTALKLPPFFFWLAVAEDPNCLLSFELNHGSLPLHDALGSLRSAAPSCLSLIRFPTEHLTDQVDHVAHATLLDLFNKRTAVQLLCHLAPQACRTGIPDPDSTSADDVLYVLDVFLWPILNSSCFSTDDRPPVYVLSHQELLDDIHAVISNSPMALVTRNPDFGLYRFCLPQLQNSASELSFSTVESENMARLSLTLAYDLLRSNPTAITRHVNDDSSLTVPHAEHDTVLTQPVQLERRNSQEIESSKRVIVALPKDAEMLKRRKM